MEIIEYNNIQTMLEDIYSHTSSGAKVISADNISRLRVGFEDTVNNKRWEIRLNVVAQTFDSIKIPGISKNSGNVPFFNKDIILKYLNHE